LLIFFYSKSFTHHTRVYNICTTRPANFEKKFMVFSISMNVCPEVEYKRTLFGGTVRSERRSQRRGQYSRYFLCEGHFSKRIFTTRELGYCYCYWNFTKLKLSTNLWTIWTELENNDSSLTWQKNKITLKKYGKV